MKDSEENDYLKSTDMVRIFKILQLRSQYHLIVDVGIVCSRGGMGLMGYWFENGWNISNAPK